MEYDKLLPNKDEKADGDADFLAMDRRRRSYELCLVFRCKPDKGIRDPIADRMEERPELREGTAAEKQKIDVLRQRREAILKSLQNCGLRLFCYYSRDRDEVLVKIGAPPQKLRDTAARMKYKLQLKSQYLSAYAEFRHDFPGLAERGYKDRRIISHIYKPHTDEDFTDSDAIFKSLDKIQIIHRIITSKDKDCAGINVGALLHEGEIVGYFPLQESFSLGELRSSKLEWFLMREEFANKFRDYFGDKVAFYFLFLAFFWKWLVPLALIGILLQLIDMVAQTPDNLTAIPFCLLMAIWSTCLPYFWRRQEAKYAIGWGSLDLADTLEPVRPEHHGDPRINPVTAQVESYFPWSKRYALMVQSAIVMVLAGGASVAIVLSLIYLRHHMEGSVPALIWLFQIGLAAIVEVLNWVLSLIARYLTTRENHRTQSEHEAHLMAKTLVFKFTNSYLVLFYTAFYKHQRYLFGSRMECWQDDCFFDLSSQLAVFVFFRILVTKTLEFLKPKVALWWRSLFLQRQTFAATLTMALNGRTPIELADMSVTEQQSKKDKYDEFARFDDVLLSYGFATFFTVTSPWVCFATLAATLIQIFMDMRSIFDNQQRPLPKRARTNEPWNSAFDIFAVIAASTNILLLIFVSDEYDAWTFAEKLVLFIYVEHLILFARLLVQVIFPAVPKNVQLLHLKQEHMVHRCLENIRVEQDRDFTMFRDNAMENIDVFESDLYEREDPEDSEPPLMLGESILVFFRGLKDAVLNR